MHQTISDVVSSGRCHRCGVCAGVCPQEAIAFDERALPVVLESCNECGLCLKVCSGHEYSIPENSEFGLYGRCYLSASSDSDVRCRGASGGVVTEILRYVLKTGRVKRVVVTSASRNDPAMPSAFFVSSEKEIIDSAQSKYCLFPWGMVLRDVIKSGDTFAVVGLACQIQSLRKAMAVLPELRRNAVLLVGLFCESNIEPGGIRHLLKIRGAAGDQLERIYYRHGTWPGVMMARLKDGKEIVLSSRRGETGAVNYLKMTYGQRRCRSCHDVICASADISVGDPWVRSDVGRYTYEGSDGFSAVSVRSKRGLEIFDKMADDGVITREEWVPEKLLGVQIAQMKRNGKQSCFEKIIYTLGHMPLFRGIFLRLMFSSIGDKLTSLNALRKRRKWRKSECGVF